MSKQIWIIGRRVGERACGYVRITLGAGTVWGDQFEATRFGDKEEAQRDADAFNDYFAVKGYSYLCFVEPLDQFDVDSKWTE